jgi:positive regulator of sigma E activity
MKETATILEIQGDGDTVLLQFHEQEACGNCNSMFCKANERTFTAQNIESLDLKKGDVVTVFLPAGKTIQASFLLLIAPLILFFIFFVLSERIFGIKTEIVKIGIGLAGLLLGFLISYGMTKKSKNSSMPRIIEKKLP